MAEPTERPGTPSAPEPTPSGLRVPPPTMVAAVAPPEPAAESEPYRPLSVLAILGFAVTLLFTVLLVLIGGVALLRQFPLFYPLLLLLPLFGLGLSLTALLRVSRSEGTLGGGRLALWGAFLGLLTILAYSGYLMAITLVVRDQSIAAARAWITDLTKGDVARAFNASLNPEGKSHKEGRALAEEMEEHNRSEQPTKVGPMTEFSRVNYVQYLRNGGADTKIEAIGVHDWQYTQGGYLVHVECRLRTPEAAATLMVGMFGTSRPNVPGRDWTMRPTETHLMTQEPGGFEATEYGKEAYKARKEAAMNFVVSWQWDVYHHRGFAAYLATRPPQERTQLKERIRLAMAARVAIGLVAPALAIPDDPGWYLDGFKGFTEGSYCVTTPQDFYPSDPKVRSNEFERQAQVDAARQAIRDGRYTFEPTVDAISSRNGDVFTAECPISLLLPPFTMIEGSVLAETDAKALDRGETPKTWRIAGVKFFRSRTIMVPPGTIMRAPPFVPPPQRPLPQDD